MSAQTREAMLSWVQDVRSPTRAERRRQRAWVAAGAFAWSVAVLALFQGVRIAPRPAWLALATTLGAAALAAVALWMAAGRGASMLGRSRRAVMAVVLGVPLALFLWKVGLTECVRGMSNAWPGRPGTRCFFVALLSGAGPFAALLWARRGTVVVDVAWMGAAMGVAAGAVGWTVNDLRCQVGYLNHLLLGHVAPVIIFVLLGLALARWLAPRWRDRSN